MSERGRIRWYNPKLAYFEWREIPKSDEEALSLLDGYPSCKEHAEVYGEWRDLGADIAVALIRAGDTAREKGEE